LKIIITGNGGTGKSTLGEELGKTLGLPVTHLDKLGYGKNWVRLDEIEHRKTLNAILNSNNWIVEGWSYQSTLKERMERADIIIYLAYPAWFSYMNAVKRHLQYTFRYNPYDPPESWIWKKTIKMFKAMNLVRKVYEPEFRKWLEEYKSRKTVFVITKRHELKKLTEELHKIKNQ
jgi:adenylate kinase family enzyme